MENLKIAHGKPVDEFRAMEVGDKVLFPISEYNYSTIRALQSSALVEERCEGKNWKTNLSIPHKGVVVTRLS